MKTAIKNSFGILLFASLQIGLVGNLPWRAAQLDLCLVLMIYLLMVYGFNKALIYGLGFAVILEIFSGFGYGVVMLALLTTLLLCYYLFQVLFTNKSIYSLIVLTAAGTFCYHLIISLCAGAYVWYFSADNFQGFAYASMYAEIFLWSLLINTIFILLVYILSGLFVRRFQAGFIDTVKH